MKSLFTLFLAAALTCSAAAESIHWGYYNATQPIFAWGTSKAETYSLCMAVNDPSLVGGKVTAVLFPLTTSELSNCAVFFSQERPKPASAVATGDLCNVSFTAAEGWNEVTLDAPLTIGEEPFYVGLTGKISDVSTDNGKLPFQLCLSGEEGSCYAVSTRTYRTWTDLAELSSYTLPIQLVVEGDMFADHAVGIVSLSTAYIEANVENPLKVKVTNHGKQPVTSIDWTYTLGDYVTQGTAEVNLPGNYYGELGELSVTLPAVSELGIYTGTLSLDKVNGNANEDGVSSLSHEVHVLSIVPVKRPLVEEFTGCWCGYCPRGWLGLKLMNEWHPDDFIAASYHNSDAMQICSSAAFPVEVGGLPAACIDRHLMTDAYSGDNDQPMGIDAVWTRISTTEHAPANVSVTATIDVTGQTLSATSYYTFCEDQEAASYGVAYIVTADGLSGTTSDWRQTNYYAGSASDRDGYLNELTNSPGSIFLVYDDVVIAQSHSAGGCYRNIFPAMVVMGQQVRHSCQFSLSKMVSNYGRRENLVQDIDRLNVIALLIDKTGAVVNAGKCHVDASAVAGIESVGADLAPEHVFDLSGREIRQQHPQGLFIRRGKLQLNAR